MGRYNFAAQKVHAHATQLLQLNRLAAPPAWYNVVGTVPTAETLTRKPMQRHPKRSRKASRMFKPVQLRQPEDKLRWEFFNDHPWELARPRIVLEDDGRDSERWDWSHALCRPLSEAGDSQGRKDVQQWERKQTEQAGRPLNGESVVQRQKWLMRNLAMSEAAAYDKARKEFYRARHSQEVEHRIAREEAQFYGGFFGLGSLEVGMMLEDKAYDQWREWAGKQIAMEKAVAGSAYSGPENEQVGDDSSLETDAQEVASNIPGSRTGQAALGGAAIHP